MMEPKGNGKAEASFRAVLETMINLRDWEGVYDAFQQYGSYLLLTGANAPVGEVRVFTR